MDWYHYNYRTMKGNYVSVLFLIIALSYLPKYECVTIDVCCYLWFGSLSEHGLWRCMYVAEIFVYFCYSGVQQRSRR